MRIKQFFGYAVIYILVIGIFVFIENSDSYTLSFLGFSKELPFVAWFLMPLLLFTIFTLLHLCFVGFLIYRDKKAIQNDEKTFTQMLQEALFGLDNDKAFKTKIFKDAAEVVKFLSKSDEISQPNNEQLRDAIKTLKAVEAGKFEDLKRFKLPKTNKIWLQNEENRLNSEPKFAYEILNKRQNFSDDLINKAYKSIIKNAPFLDIKKYGIPTQNDDIMMIIDRYLSDDKFEISREDFYEIIKNSSFSDSEYIKLFRMLKNKFSPDILLQMFERLKNDNADANDAYWYGLYELGMIDELRNQLHYNDGKNNEKFEILLFLRDNNKSVPASLLFS